MYLCIHTYTRACVNPGPWPFSWIGESGAGTFFVDAKINGDWKVCLYVNHKSN